MTNDRDGNAALNILARGLEQVGIIINNQTQNGKAVKSQEQTNSLSQEPQVL